MMGSVTCTAVGSLLHNIGASFLRYDSDVSGHEDHIVPGTMKCERPLRSLSNTHNVAEQSIRTLTPGEVIQYHCLPGHTVDAEPLGPKHISLYCDTSLKLVALLGSSAELACLPVICGRPPIIENATIKIESVGDISYPGNVKFQCRKGMIPFSQNSEGNVGRTDPSSFELKCGEEGSWIPATIPRCEFRCPVPPPPLKYSKTIPLPMPPNNESFISTMSVDDRSVPIGFMVKYECLNQNSPYGFHGHEDASHLTMTCVSSFQDNQWSTQFESSGSTHQWNTTDEICPPISCSRQVPGLYNTIGLDLGDILLTGANRVAVKCKEGYISDSASQGTISGSDNSHVSTGAPYTSYVDSNSTNSSHGTWKDFVTVGCSDAGNFFFEQHCVPITCGGLENLPKEDLRYAILVQVRVGGMLVKSKPVIDSFSHFNVSDTLSFSCIYGSNGILIPANFLRIAEIDIDKSNHGSKEVTITYSCEKDGVFHSQSKMQCGAPCNVELDLLGVIMVESVAKTSASGVDPISQISHRVMMRPGQIIPVACNGSISTKYVVNMEDSILKDSRANQLILKCSRDGHSGLGILTTDHSIPDYGVFCKDACEEYPVLRHSQVIYKGNGISSNCTPSNGTKCLETEIFEPYSRVESSVLQYECQKGYTSPPVFICMRTSDPLNKSTTYAPETSKNIKIISNDVQLKEGARVRSWSTLKWVHTNTLSAELTDCVVQRCSRPVYRLGHGELRTRKKVTKTPNQYSYNDVVYYDCVDGKSSFGSTCSETGQWELPPKTCFAVFCRFFDVHNGKISTLDLHTQTNVTCPWGTSAFSLLNIDHRSIGSHQSREESVRISCENMVHAHIGKYHLENRTSRIKNNPLLMTTNDTMVGILPSGISSHKDTILIRTDSFFENRSNMNGKKSNHYVSSGRGMLDTSKLDSNKSLGVRIRSKTVNMVTSSLPMIHSPAGGISDDSVHLVEHLVSPVSAITLDADTANNPPVICRRKCPNPSINTFIHRYNIVDYLAHNVLHGKESFGQSPITHGIDRVTNKLNILKPDSSESRRFESDQGMALAGDIVTLPCGVHSTCSPHGHWSPHAGQVCALGIGCEWMHFSDSDLITRNATHSVYWCRLIREFSISVCTDGGIVWPHSPCVDSVPVDSPVLRINQTDGIDKTNMHSQ